MPNSTKFYLAHYSFLFCTIFLFLTATAIIPTPCLADKGLPSESALPEHAQNPNEIILKFFSNRSQPARNKFLRKIITQQESLLRRKIDWQLHSLIPTEPLTPAHTARSKKALRDLSSFSKLNLSSSLSHQILVALRNSPEIEFAYLALLPAPPPIAKLDLAPTTPNYGKKQKYIRPSPQGMDITFARSQLGGNGAGIKIFDLEFGWLASHEDLAINRSSYTNNNAAESFRDHGTAVAGILSGIKNRYGIRGIADGATLLLTPVFDTSGSYNLPYAIYEAVNASQAGDIILLEQQFLGPQNADCICGANCEFYVPVEYDPATYSAIQFAASAGRVVIEAAGNGGISLDSAVFSGAFNPSLYNSGAIMIGAVKSGNKEAHCFSNQGARINLNSWGNGVATTGYGDLLPASDLTGSTKNRQKYTAVFAGTSSASALVAGAAAAFQGYALAQGGILTPAQVHGYLWSTGVISPSNGIGRMPNLRAAIAALNSDRGL